MKTRTFVSCLALLIHLAQPGAAQAQSAAEFYQNRPLRVIVPTGVGGSYALYGQLFADNFARHVPGAQAVIFSTMPGAGGVVSLDYVSNVAPKDGTVIGEIMSQSLLVPMIRPAGFDPLKMKWIGSLASRPGVVGVWSSAKVKSLADAKQFEATLAATGIGAGNYQIPAMANLVIGTKFKLITGYKSAGDMNMALERNEVDGRFNYWSGWTSTKPDWIRDGKLKFLFRTGPHVDGMPDVPSLADLTSNENDRLAVKLLEAPDEIGVAFYVSSDVSEDRASLLRKAFAEMLNDKDFQEAARKLDLPIDFVPHENIESILRAIYGTPAAVRERLKPLLAVE